MTSKRQNKKSNIKKQLKTPKTLKVVSPLAERLGVFLIALITIMGATLIVYTGAQATLYSPQERPELLTLDDIDLESTTDDIEQTGSTAEENVQRENEDETNGTDDQDEDKSTSIMGVITDDGVNVRERPEANELTNIYTQLNTGDEIEVINSEYNEDWIQVNYNGQTGYVFKEFVDLVE